MKEIDIIATIGPASQDIKIMKKMKKNGMTIGRINTKYGNEQEFNKTHSWLKKINCKVLFDIKSLKYIKYLKEKDFDWLAISYAESKKQIDKIRKMFSKKIKIIAKIETQKGIDNLEPLLLASDGIMVARGDLGKNISFEKVPIMQKIIIKKANKKKVFVITATEMLMSIVKSKSAKKSEISDIANAVLDGSNALMLSEETAIGHYPSIALKIMKKTISSTIENKKYL